MTSTVVSWALTLSLVGVGVYVYKPDLFKGLNPPSTPNPLPSSSGPVERPTTKRPKSKKSQASKTVAVDDDATPSSANEASSGKKRKITTASGSGTTTTKHSIDADAGTKSGGVDEIDLADQDFAHQLAKTQAGTKLQKPEGQKSGKKNKAPKNPQPAKFESTGFSTETSSTAGRDGDDDLTPADSSMVQTNGEPSAAGDISDMLEAPISKPTTLRLTGVHAENKPKPKPKAQPFEQVLTKKQRQAQARKEELRQMKDESDRLHEAKKQEQLRRARTAAGTSNQTKANNFTSSSSGNAWQANRGSEAVKAPPTGSTAPLLDTFEPSSNNVSQPHGAVHTSNLSSVPATDAAELKQEMGSQRASAVAASTREGQQRNGDVLAGNISEEEQIQLLQEQQAEDAWESVTSKKSKKKTRNEANEVSGYNAPVAMATAPRVQSAGTRNPGVPAHRDPDTNNRFGSFQAPRSDNLADAEWEA